MASSATSYASGSDLVKYHDARRIGDLISDTDTRIASASVPANAVVTAALLRASGEVEMAAQVGGKYTPTDLAGLTGAAAEALIGLVCDLAVWHIEKRRARGITPADVPGAAEAYEVLAALREGNLVFPTANAIDAMTQEVVEPTGNDTCEQDQCGGRYGETVGWARRFFGRRGGGCC